MNNATTSGARPTILLLEDEMLPALVVEGVLSDAGYDVVGPVPNVEQALELLRGSRVDAAILDLNLHGTFSYDVGNRCDALGIPWGVTTGYEPQTLDLAARDIPILVKPFTEAQLLAMVAGLLGR
ncbi:hypothetical protein WG901_07180 [Novosphingobium sp. PS1R-30]|uniref:Response regulatory domain-containing protein n=1 Tax=Novosphingobium anseongense TaxID=3133436 RepID=A0ABU8RTI6_9SPHN|nr:MAG: response regulator [Novosphingobium sp.]